MTTTAIRRLHFWYGICLAILTLVVGILFIAQAADIYYSGLNYSRELVIERCTAIAAPFWIWVAAIVAGGVIWMIYPEAEKKLKRLPDERADVVRLTQLAADSGDPKFVEAKAAVEREKKIRRVVWLSCLTVCLICAGVALYFIFNLPSYPADPNEAILSLVRTALPCIIVAFAAAAGAAVFDAISAKKVLPYARQMLAVGGKAQVQPRAPGKIAAVLQSPITLWGVRLAVLVVAIVFIILGVMNGGMADVLGKAINICTECIGLG